MQDGYCAVPHFELVSRGRPVHGNRLQTHGTACYTLASFTGRSGGDGLGRHTATWLQQVACTDVGCWYVFTGFCGMDCQLCMLSVALGWKAPWEHCMEFEAQPPSQRAK